MNIWDRCDLEEVDMVNHPPHYNSHPSGIEQIEVTGHMNFCLGNAVKYIWRCDDKDDAIQDLEKAIFYLNWEIKRRNGETSKEEGLREPECSEREARDGTADALKYFDLKAYNKERGVFDPEHKLQYNQIGEDTRRTEREG
jgi:hypothetical protein